ncbi:MAG: Uma2 family endonuclease, partial [Candidatus Eremiobacteraeota bacterium]|nr:Uma2 family endonuclease [Candidatus Eremiobacteraeota bacterium]
MYAFISEKPYIEFHAGRELRKVSPNVPHALLETALSRIFWRCAGERGKVLTECHFDMSIQLGTKTLLVPDVAFVRRERLFGFSDDYLQVPAFAPDIAVEIRSPSDRLGEREWKIATYLEAESAL